MQQRIFMCGDEVVAIDVAQTVPSERSPTVLELFVAKQADCIAALEAELETVKHRLADSNNGIETLSEQLAERTKEWDAAHAAGMEQAAKICEKIADGYGDRPTWLLHMRDGANECFHAIRSAIPADAQAEMDKVVREDRQFVLTVMLMCVGRLGHDFMASLFDPKFATPWERRFESLLLPAPDDLFLEARDAARKSGQKGG